jgi:hypothetical protein
MARFDIEIDALQFMESKEIENETVRKVGEMLENLKSAAGEG